MHLVSNDYPKWGEGNRKFRLNHGTEEEQRIIENSKNKQEQGAKRKKETNRVFEKVETFEWDSARQSWYIGGRWDGLWVGVRGGTICVVVVW